MRGDPYPLRDFPRRGKQGCGRWGATPYRCFAEPLRRGADPLQSKTPLFPGRDLPCLSEASQDLRSSIPSQRVPKLCHATAPLCISITAPGNSFAVLRFAFAGGESGRHKGLYSRVLRFADALPRLALPMRKREMVGIDTSSLCPAFPWLYLANPLRWVSMPLRFPDRLSDSRASQCRCNTLLFLCCVLPSLCYASPKPRPTYA